MDSRGVLKIPAYEMKVFGYRDQNSVKIFNVFSYNI